MDVFVACFDIEDDKARRRVGKILLEYGERVQYSVFEISFRNKHILGDIKARCQSHIEESDSLLFYALPANARKLSHDVWDNPIAVYPQGIIL
jgi:CRISPR-associated protein Cas2